MVVVQLETLNLLLIIKDYFHYMLMSMIDWIKIVENVAFKFKKKNYVK